MMVVLATRMHRCPAPLQVCFRTALAKSSRSKHKHTARTWRITAVRKSGLLQCQLAWGSVGHEAGQTAVGAGRGGPALPCVPHLASWSTAARAEQQGQAAGRWPRAVSGKRPRHVAAPPAHTMHASRTLWLQLGPDCRPPAPPPPVLALAAQARLPGSDQSAAAMRATARVLALTACGVRGGGPSPYQPFSLPFIAVGKAVWSQGIQYEVRRCAVPRCALCSAFCPCCAALSCAGPLPC